MDITAEFMSAIINAFEANKRLADRAVEQVPDDRLHVALGAHTNSIAVMRNAMTPLYHDPHFTFRFADDRIIPRFHLEGIGAGRRVMVYKINPDSGERLDLLANATVREGGWMDLLESIIVRAGEAFIVVPEPAKEL